MVPPAKEWGSHAITFVVFNHDGKEIWSLQDAYFNNCVTDENGQPLDYLEFLKRLKDRQHYTVVLT